MRGTGRQSRVERTGGRRRRTGVTLEGETKSNAFTFIVVSLAAKMGGFGCLQNM